MNLIVPARSFNYGNASLFFSTKDIIQETIPHDNNMKFLKQVHGNEVVWLQSPEQTTEGLEADAIVTTLKGVNLCIRTADCVPILLYDPATETIAGIHAGWRGALFGVIDNTIDLMGTRGCDCNDMIAFIGPCIRKESYEVDQGFFERFKQLDERSIYFFDEIKEQNFSFDLPGYCTDLLIKRGIAAKNIFDSGLDTFTAPETFFSYRYYQKNDLELLDEQRQVSMIRLR